MKHLFNGSFFVLISAPGRPVIFQLSEWTIYGRKFNKNDIASNKKNK